MMSLNARKKVMFFGKIAVSVCVLWMVFRYLGTAETRDRLAAADSGWVLAGSGCIIGVQIIKAWRFVTLGQAMDHPVPVRSCLLAHLITPILGFFTPGKLGEGVKIMYLDQSKRELGFLFIIERLMDMTALLAVAGFGFVFQELSPVTYLAMAAILLLVVGVLLRLDWFLNLVTRFVFKKEYFTRNWFMERLKRSLTPRIFVPAVLTIGVWSVTFTASWCFAKSVGIHLSYLRISLVFAWAVIMGLVSSLPGGVGVREGGITLLLNRLYAVPRPHGTALAAVNLGMHYFVLSVLAVIGYTGFRFFRPAGTSGSG